MNETSNNEYLEESLEFWQSSADKDKKHVLSSFLLSSVGLVPITVGVDALISGDVIGGILAIGSGGLFSAMWIHEGLDDLESYTYNVSRAAIRQDQLDQL